MHTCVCHFPILASELVALRRAPSQEVSHAPRTDLRSRQPLSEGESSADALVQLGAAAGGGALGAIAAAAVFSRGLRSRRKQRR